MSNSSLSKIKYPENDLFICDVADAVIKDIVPEMEHPFYSLSKKPVLEISRYEHNGNYIEITPSLKGQATIYDKDILIYAISQMLAKIKNGEEIKSKKVRINAYDLLRFVERSTSGRDYANLEDAFDRLAGTTIKTNIQVDGKEEIRNFNILESTLIVRKDGLNGRMQYCEITLSDWTMKAIENREKYILTLHRDYFRLKKPIDRRVYEIARKHCGTDKSEWGIFIDTLYKKSGSKAKKKEFRRSIKKMCEANELPDYNISFDEENDKAIFKPKSKWIKGESDIQQPPLLQSETYQAAKNIAPDGADVYALEQEWLDWWRSKGSQKLKNADKAFLQFVLKKAD